MRAASKPNQHAHVKANVATKKGTREPAKVRLAMLEAAEHISALAESMGMAKSPEPRSSFLIQAHFVWFTSLTYASVSLVVPFYCGTCQQKSPNCLWIIRTDPLMNVVLVTSVAIGRAPKPSAVHRVNQRPVALRIPS